MDPLTLMMIGVLALMVVMMVRNSRKQKSARDELNAKIAKGAPVMSTSGIFGTIVSINDDENEVVIETTPGTKIRLHRQAIASVVEPKATVDTAKGASAAKASQAKSSAKPVADSSQ